MKICAGFAQSTQRRYAWVYDTRTTHFKNKPSQWAVLVRTQNRLSSSSSSPPPPPPLPPPPTHYFLLFFLSFFATNSTTTTNTTVASAVSTTTTPTTARPTSSSSSSAAAAAVAAGAAASVSIWSDLSLVGLGVNSREARRTYRAPPSPPPPPSPHQEPSTMVPKCTLGCPEHNLTCSPDSHWDALGK